MSQSNIGSTSVTGNPQGNSPPIRDFEARVAALRVAHGPGCAGLGQSAIAGLTDAESVIVVREAVHLTREARLSREIAAGFRPESIRFLNSFARALLVLPPAERERRLGRCPKVLQVHARPMIAEYQEDQQAFVTRVGIAACVNL